MLQFPEGPLPLDIPSVRCSLSDGRTVTAVHEAEAEAIWAEITGDSPYRRAATGLPPDEVIIDAGAHIGLASLCFAEQVPGARVLAFEPAPRTFACLEANLAQYVPGSTAFQQAVGATPGTAELIFHPYVASASTLYDDESDDGVNLEAYLANTGADEESRALAWLSFNATETVAVEVTTLGAVLREQAVDRVGLLKVDVERGELDVLRGIDADYWPRIRRVVLEVHDIDGRLGTIVGMLAGLSYRVVVTQYSVYAGGSVYIVLASREEL